MMRTRSKRPIRTRPAGGRDSDLLLMSTRSVGWLSQTALEVSAADRGGDGVVNKEVAERIRIIRNTEKAFRRPVKMGSRLGSGIMRKLLRSTW